MRQRDDQNKTLIKKIKTTQTSPKYDKTCAQALKGSVWWSQLEVQLCIGSKLQTRPWAHRHDLFNKQPRLLPDGRPSLTRTDAKSSSSLLGDKKRAGEGCNVIMEWQHAAGRHSTSRKYDYLCFNAWFPEWQKQTPCRVNEEKTEHKMILNIKTDCYSCEKTC